MLFMETADIKTQTAAWEKGTRVINIKISALLKLVSVSAYSLIGLVIFPEAKTLVRSFI